MRHQLAALSLCFLNFASAAVPPPSSPCKTYNCLDAGFDVTKVVNHAKRLSSHSWEYGTASEALLELYDKEISVFGKRPFPGGKVPKVKVEKVQSLVYAKQWIEADNETFIDGDGAVGDPASLGVFALLIGNSSPSQSAYLSASARGLHSVLTAPRFYNDAISQRYSTAELWADFIYMAPPFMAYHAVSAHDPGLLRETVRQCGLYRQVLKANTTAPYRGLWEHIIGPESEDPGLWSTGNGWAAMGMTRVLATMMRWEKSKGWKKEIATLKGYIKEIIDGAMHVDMDDGLLRNYLNDTTWFGEISGTGVLAATVYRMAVLDPATYVPKYTKWADKLRIAVAAHVRDDGIISPAVNPLGWGDREPFTTGSPEGQSFGTMLYAAYRDWKTG